MVSRDLFVYLSCNNIFCTGGIHQLPIETVLSKSFSLSSYSEQSQIIPYYYKAELNLTGEDITIVTLVTRNRIPNLARLATQYQGTTIKYIKTITTTS